MLTFPSCEYKGQWPGMSWEGHWQGVGHNMAKKYMLPEVGTCSSQEEAEQELRDLVPTSSQSQAPLQVDSCRGIDRWMLIVVANPPVQSNDRLTAATAVCRCSNVVAHRAITCS